MSIHASAPTKLRFLPRLEALRGLAAVAVVGYHASNNEVVTGMAPVVVFFVLSGFVLARSLEVDPSAFRFFRNRIFRLFPAAAGTVALLTVLYWFFGFFVGYKASFDPLDVVLNSLMIRSDINGVMWSLTVECVAAPLILVCFLGCRSYGAAPLLVLSVALFGASFYGPYVHLLGGFSNLAPLYAFVFGVLLHFAVVRGVSPPHTALIALPSMLLLLCCGLRKQTAPIILLEAASAGGLIFSIATQRSSLIFSALDFAIVRFFGRISYSFYLLHPIGLALAIRTAPSYGGLIFLCALAYTAPMAWLSWRLAEVPFLRLKRSNDANDVIANNCRLDDRVGVAAAGVVGIVDADAASG